MVAGDLSAGLAKAADFIGIVGLGEISGGFARGVDFIGSIALVAGAPGGFGDISGDFGLVGGLATSGGPFVFSGAFSGMTGKLLP